MRQSNDPQFANLLIAIGDGRAGVAETEHGATDAATHRRVALPGIAQVNSPAAFVDDVFPQRLARCLRRAPSSARATTNRLRGATSLAQLDGEPTVLTSATQDIDCRGVHVAVVPFAGAVVGTDKDGGGVGRAART
jgi:hypothetical protein